MLSGGAINTTKTMQQAITTLIPKKGVLKKNDILETYFSVMSGL